MIDKNSVSSIGESSIMKKDRIMIVDLNNSGLDKDKSQDNESDDSMNSPKNL